MVPHSWVLKCIEMMKVADNVIKFIDRSMMNWVTKLVAGKETLRKVRRRGIFQDDSLSPLLFVLAMIPLSLVLRNVKADYDIGKEGVLSTTYY